MVGLNIEKAALSTPMLLHRLRCQKVRAMMNLWIAGIRIGPGNVAAGKQEEEDSDDAAEIAESRERIGVLAGSPRTARRTDQRSL